MKNDVLLCFCLSNLSENTPIVLESAALMHAKLVNNSTIAISL